MFSIIILKYLGSRGYDKSSISFNDVLFKRATPLHASIIGRKSWFERNKYDESLKIAQDYDLWLRSSKANDFNCRIMSDRLYYYREENNATPKKVLAAYKNERVMFRKYAGSQYFKLWFKSMMKSLMVSTLSLLNMESILLKRRSSKEIDQKEREEYYNQIQIIESIELPKF